ncbi:MAG: sugar phosphate isomerase/epimerase [SAR324 cluster bacterium]|nr:sugar phosphate isomerase/epimerase [SAR324 cluster bacterium]
MLDEVSVTKARRSIRDSGVRAEALCALVLIDSESEGDHQSQRLKNQQIFEIAAELEVSSVVVITGGLPSDSKDIQFQKEAVLAELEFLLPAAEKLGVSLSLEPLHPMVCGMRSVISSLRDAVEILDDLSHPNLTIALDSYALWWDQGLEEQIHQAGTRIRHLHVSDWLPQTKDLRLDRGMPGNGCIDNRKIRTWLEREGFKGPVEVEIFSAFDWWLRPADEMVKTICDRLGFL